MFTEIISARKVEVSKNIICCRGEQDPEVLKFERSPKFWKYLCPKKKLKEKPSIQSYFQWTGLKLIFCRLLERPEKNIQRCVRPPNVTLVNFSTSFPYIYVPSLLSSDKGVWGLKILLLYKYCKMYLHTMLRNIIAWPNWPEKGLKNSSCWGFTIL